MNPPETRYANADGVYIAYQVVGAGDTDLVFLPNWFSNIELFWQDAVFERFMTRLTSFSRLIVFDQRGTGASDPVGMPDLLSLEERARDIIAVMDAAGSKRAVIFASSITSPLALFFAASHPDRTEALVVQDGTARFLRADDYPFGDPPESIEDDVRHVLEKTTLARHDTTVRRSLERFGGRLVQTTGDGVLATFDGPARAVRCTQQLHDAARRFGVEIRADFTPVRSRSRVTTCAGWPCTSAHAYRPWRERARPSCRAPSSISLPDRARVRGSRRARAEGRPAAVADLRRLRVSCTMYT